MCASPLTRSDNYVIASCSTHFRNKKSLAGMLRERASQSHTSRESSSSGTKHRTVLTSLAVGHPLLAWPEDPFFVLLIIDLTVWLGLSALRHLFASGLCLRLMIWSFSYSDICFRFVVAELLQGRAFTKTSAAMASVRQANTAW